MDTHKTTLFLSSFSAKTKMFSTPRAMGTPQDKITHHVFTAGSSIWLHTIAKRLLLTIYQAK